MKVIALWEPWSTLMATGKKKLETRSWGTDYRGPVALHSTSGGLTKGALYDQCRDPLFLDGLGWKQSMMPIAAQCGSLPFGKIIGVFLLADSLPMEYCGDCDGCGWCEGGAAIKTTCRTCAGGGVVPRGVRLTAEEHAFGNYEVGRYALVAQQMFRLPEPIPFKSRQGKLLDLPAEIEAEVTRQWRAVR